MIEPLDQDSEVLAMELAIGLLDTDEKAAATERLDGDSAFAAAYTRWSDALSDSIFGADEAPRPSLWDQIIGRLPANDAAPPVRSAAGWKIATAAASIAAVALGTYALRPTPTRVVVRQVAVERAAPAPTLAMLTTGDARAAVAVSINRSTGELSLLPVKLDLTRKVPELWVIPAGGKPHALGVVNAALNNTIRPPATVLALVAPGATLAISEEPIGGSPTGQPTGRILVTGTVPLRS